MVESTSSSLKTVFTTYTAGQPAIDNKQYVKLMKDCKILGGKLTTTDLDIDFAKVKDSPKKMSYEAFQEALKLAAAKKEIDYEELVKKICEVSTGPKYSGTQAQYVKFHDDKSTYTGVYAKGGPTNVDIGKGKISDLSQLCDRTQADVRGSKK